MPQKKENKENLEFNELKDSVKVLRDEMISLKDTLDNVTKDIKSLENERKNDRSHIDSLMVKIGELTKENSSLLKRLKESEEHILRHSKGIVQLESRIEEVEQYTRKDDLIVTGLEVKQSYARVTSGEPVDREVGLPDTSSTVGSVENQVIDFMNKQNIQLTEGDISACHTIGKRKGNRGNLIKKPTIVVRLVSRKTKMRLLQEGKKLKGTDVYLNDHLSRKNSEIAKAARNMKRDGNIERTWTRNCYVFIKTKGTTKDQGKIHLIKEMEELQQFR